MDSPCWTDSLETDESTGIGFQTNILYRHNGPVLSEHTFEDRNFRYVLPDSNLVLLGVVDGHDGAAAEYFATRIPAELLLGQLSSNTTDEEIKEALRSAFAAAERGYFAAGGIGSSLLSRANLLAQMPSDLNIHSLTTLYPEEVKQLAHVNEKISSGCTAVVALIIDNKLFVCNVGDCRALLCRQTNGDLRVIQCSVDHDVQNADERLRLTQLGLTDDQLVHLHHPTRCLGDFPRKGGYQDFEYLRDAVAEPVIFDPEVQGPIRIDRSSQFLFLMTAGLWRNLADATGRDASVNVDIAGMIAAEFQAQTTLNGVAQAVVDRISRCHHDAFLCDDDRAFLCSKREDMTLLVRNFYFPLPNGGLMASSNHSLVGIGIDMDVDCNAASDDATMRVGGVEDSNGVGELWEMQSGGTGRSLVLDEEPCSHGEILLDENRRIAPYVSFDEFYAAVFSLEEKQRQKLQQQADAAEDSSTSTTLPDTTELSEAE